MSVSELYEAMQNARRRSRIAFALAEKLEQFAEDLVAGLDPAQAKQLLKSQRKALKRARELFLKSDELHEMACEYRAQLESRGVPLAE